MKKIAIVAALMAAGSLACASGAWAIEPVPGNYTFTFTGQCTNCTGNGTATLQVQDYTPGTAFSESNFVDFTYSSNQTSVDINPAKQPGFGDLLQGAIGTEPGSYGVRIQSVKFVVPLQFFESGGDGFWQIFNNVNVHQSDFGTMGTWNGVATSAVPEPSIWIMMLGGIAMMGAALRFGRKRNGLALAA